MTEVAEEEQIPALSPSRMRYEFPADLVLIVGWLAATVGIIYLTPPTFVPLRVVLAIPVILFIPGYCLLCSLFPGNGDVDLMTRMVLSVGVSIVIVPLIGLGLNFTPWGIHLDTIVISLSLFTIVMVIVTWYMRSTLPSEKRFRMPFSEIATDFRQGFLKKDGSGVDKILTVALVLALLITIIITVYVISVPREGEKYTAFFILGENQTAANYPDQIVPGREYSMYVGVRNHEYRDVQYTVETWMLRTEFDNMTNSSRILAMDPYDRLMLTLAHNETIIIPYNLSVRKSGYNRVEFLLFNDIMYYPDLTGRDRINASYRELHLGVAG